jgi:cytochrome P450
MPLTDRSWSTYDKPNLPPAPRRSSLLQTLIGLARPYAYADKIRARYGSRFTIYMVDMPPLVFLSDPQDIKAIATASAENLHSGKGGMLLAPVFGERAFMLLEKGEHASVREAITPMFHNRMVRGHTNTIAEVVEREVSSWPADDAVSLSPHLDRLTLKVMLRIVIADRELVCGERMYEELCQRMLKMLSVMATPLLQEPRLRHLPGWRGTWWRFIADREAVDELVYGLIQRRRERGAPGFPGNDSSGKDGLGNNSHGHDGAGNDSPSDKDRQRDLLDLLIAARNPDGSPLSDRQVRDNLVSTIVAGQETTAATLGWTLQLLAHDPAVQDRLIEELDGGGGNGYMDAVIQEALRHRPTFLFLPPRVVLRPTEIGGWSYRPPAQLLACTYLLHHDPRLYEDPHRFLPGRFLEGPPQPGTLLPWGLGRKRCPGRQIALIEIREVLQRVLSTWLVLPASRRIADPRWRTALLTPNPRSKLILCARHSLRPEAIRARRDSI